MTVSTTTVKLMASFLIRKQTFKSLTICNTGVAPKSCSIGVTYGMSLLSKYFLRSFAEICMYDISLFTHMTT